MKKLFALLLALLMLLGLAACGAETEDAVREAGEAGDESSDGGELPLVGDDEPAGTAAGTETVLDPSDLDLDLSICQPEEVYREIEHLNIDPSGYVGLRLRVTGEVSRFVSHDKTFYYIGVRDDDGCIENLELRFPGDGSVPAGFPEDGTVVTVWGRMGYYETERDGKPVRSAVLTDVQYTLQTDFRD